MPTSKSAATVLTRDAPLGAKSSRRCANDLGRMRRHHGKKTATAMSWKATSTTWMPLPYIALLASASPYAPSSPCSATSTKASTVPPIMATAIWSARYSTATPTMARTHLAACIAGEADEAGFGAGLGAELDARPDVGPSAGLDWTP